MRRYYVYILSNKYKTVLYVGFTNNLQRRVMEHKTKRNKGFTNKYNCDRLVYFKEFGDRDGAIAREKRIKKYSRQWKENLVNERNKEWRDLSEGWELLGGWSGV
jgi:putative endonuclease